MLWIVLIIYFFLNELFLLLVLNFIKFLEDIYHWLYLGLHYSFEIKFEIWFSG